MTPSFEIIANMLGTKSVAITFGHPGEALRLETILFSTGIGYHGSKLNSFSFTTYVHFDSFAAFNISKGFALSLLTSECIANHEEGDILRASDILSLSSFQLIKLKHKVSSYHEAKLQKRVQQELLDQVVRLKAGELTPEQIRHLEQAVRL